MLRRARAWLGTTSLRALKASRLLISGEALVATVWILVLGGSDDLGRSVAVFLWTMAGTLVVTFFVAAVRTGNIFGSPEDHAACEAREGELKRVYTKALNERDLLNERLRAAGRLLKEKDRAIAGLRRDLQRLPNEIEGLQGAIRGLEQEKRGLRAEAEGLTQRVRALEAELQRARLPRPGEPDSSLSSWASSYDRS